MKKILTGIIAIAASAVLCGAYAQEVKPLQNATTAKAEAEKTQAVTAPSDNAVEPNACVPEMSMSLLSVSATVGYESAYIFRGEKYAGHSIQPGVEFAYPICGLDIYAGAWSSSPVQGSKKDELTELDLYAGATYNYGALTFDVGYIYYWYPEVDGDEISRDMEVYCGVTLDTSSFLGININPSAYYFYNWILKQQVVELSLGYDTPIGEWLIDNEKLTLPLNLYGGYLSAGRKYGDYGGPSEGVTYFYLGASADIAYALTDYCTISAGIRYSVRNGGNEGEPVDHAMLYGRENNVWFGAKVSFGF